MVQMAQMGLLAPLVQMAQMVLKAFKA